MESGFLDAKETFLEQQTKLNQSLEKEKQNKMLFNQD